MSGRITTKEKRGSYVPAAVRLLALGGLLIAAGAAFCQSATAQTGTDQTTAPQTDQLQEVVVTAERRAIDIQTTPISIVAVSGDQLQTTQIVDLNSLGQVASSLIVYTTGSTSTADIRGIGDSNQGGLDQPGVLIVRDGLPNTSAGYGENQPYYDIADVEVLRGPQGTFAGNNSTGGAIDITSQNPNFRGINGYVDAQVATYSEQRVDGAVNLPVTNTFAMRLAVNEETRGSFFHDEYTDINGPYEAGPYQCSGAPPCIGGYPVSGDKTVSDPGNVDDKDVRLGLLWKPTDAFQSLTKIELDHEDSDGVPTQPDTYTFSPLAPGLPCPTGEGTAPLCHNTYAPGYSGSPYVLNNWASQMLMWDDDVNTFGEQLQYTLPSGIQLRLVAGDQEIGDNTVSSTSSDSLNVGSYSNGLNQFHIYNGEFDAISPTTGPFSWITGLVYTYNSEQQASYSVNTNTPYSAAAPAHGFFENGLNIWEQSRGVFGQVSWQFTHTLQLVVGAREGSDSEISLGASATQRPNGAPIVNPNDPTNGPVSDRIPTGKVDLNWTPLPGQYFYAFAARGYKPGEENLGKAPTSHYEWVNDYELGWKGRLADGHVLTSVGGYYMQYYDMLYIVFNPSTNPVTTGGTNIPYSNLKGIEASLQAREGGLTFNMNADFNKSILGPLETYASYKFPPDVGITSQCVNGMVPNATNSNCTNYIPYKLFLSGESLPYSPEYTGNATLQYSIPVGGMYVVPRVTYAYAAKTYSTIYQLDNYYLIPGHSLWGAYLDWTAGPWTTTVYGTNLANTVYLEGTGLYGNPRQIGLEMHRTF